jgi:hypothetical protein
MLLRLLITVKAYPAVGRKHGEAVCVAGIDINAQRWVRLYPVPYRDLPRYQQFDKYETIEVEAARARSDPRPESYTPNVHTLRVVGNALPGGTSDERRRIVLPLLRPSMCAILREHAEQRKSLGIFRPAELLEFRIEPNKKGWSEAQRMHAAQVSMLVPGKAGLDEIPYRFYYKYRCDEGGCPTHTQSIIDWELGALYRRLRDQESPDAVQAKICQKWATQMWEERFDTFLYVGNQFKYPASFLVLGVFWPTKPKPRDVERSDPEQGVLFPPR